MLPVPDYMTSSSQNRLLVPSQARTMMYYAQSILHFTVTNGCASTTAVRDLNREAILDKSQQSKNVSVTQVKSAHYQVFSFILSTPFLSIISHSLQSRIDVRSFDAPKLTPSKTEGNTRAGKKADQEPQEGLTSSKPRRNYFSCHTK